MLISKRFDFNQLPSIILTKEQLDSKREVEKKIKNKKYIFEYFTSCPICNSKSFEILSKKDRYGFKLNTYICKTCGIILTNPHFNFESYSKFYDSEYRSLYSSSKKPTNMFWEAQKKQGKRIWKTLSTIKEMDRKTIVEVGVGAGGILEYFKQRGNIIFGVDLGKEYISFGKQKGLNLFYGTIDKLISLRIKADVVIYSHVLEHIIDIKSELKKIKKILKKNGLLYIELPGVKNLENSYEMDFLKSIQNAHVYYFTLNTLQNLLAKENFKLIKGNEKIEAIFIIDPNMNFSLKNDYIITKSYLNKIEKKQKKSLFNFYDFKIRLINIIINITIKLGIYDFISMIYKKLRC